MTKAPKHLTSKRSKGYGMPHPPPNHQILAGARSDARKGSMLPEIIKISATDANNI
jgi:hypothetical protein